MTAPVRIRTKVLPGHRIEIVDPGLPIGGDVDVIVMTPPPPTPTPTSGDPPPSQSVLEIIESYRGQRMFKTADEVDAHLRAERDSWER